jgi:hypothetical protein
MRVIFKRIMKEAAYKIYNSITPKALLRKRLSSNLKFIRPSRGVS